MTFNRIKKASGIVVALMLAGVSTADALPFHYFQAHIGGGCFFYSGSESVDVLSRSGGIGRLHNNTGAGIKIECPAFRRHGAPGIWSWSLVGTGSVSEWSTTNCDLFSESFNTGYSFPTSRNTVTAPQSGFVQIGGDPGSDNTYYTMGETIEVGCLLPAGEAVLNYNVREFLSGPL